MSVEERDYIRVRQERRSRMKQERIRRVRRMRRMLFGGILLACLLLGVLVSSRLGSGSRGKAAGKSGELAAAGAQTVQAAGSGENDGAAGGGGDGTGNGRTGDGAGQWEGKLIDMSALYGVCVAGSDWSHFFADNSYCMAPTDACLTAFRATLRNQPEGMPGTIEYCVNLSGSGWLDWIEDAGEAGDGKGTAPLEALRVRLTGELAEYYDVLYSVLQNGAWTDWVMNGEEAGVSGAGLRVDGVRVSVVQKKPGQASCAGGIDPSKPMVALTYDDGPSKKVTPRILDKLEECGARATFFMVGQQVEKNMDVVKRMVNQGCEPGNHTYDHKLMTKVDPMELAAQLARTNQVVMDAGGVSPILMRPCGGLQNDVGMMVVGSVSMPAILWSVDTLDWKTRDAQSTIQAVLDNVKDGDIILMHDLYDATAEASMTIIPELISRGYQLVTVSELASYRGGMLPGKTYSKFRP